MIDTSELFKDIEKKQTTTYHSDIFNLDFETVKGYSLVKLPEINKTESINLPFLEKSLPGRNCRFPYIKTEEFYNDQDSYQFYRFKTRVDNNLINIHIRNGSKYVLTDNILDVLHESFLIRDCMTQKSQENLYEKLDEQYKSVLEKIKSDEDLFHTEDVELSSMYPEIRKGYIKLKSLMFLNTLNQMESNGYSPGEIIKNLKKIKIYPIKKELEDHIIKTIDNLIS